jgi:hypothetical protein
MVNEAAMCVIDAKRYDDIKTREKLENQLIEAVLGNTQTHGVNWSMLVSLNGQDSVRWQGMTYEKEAASGLQ